MFKSELKTGNSSWLRKWIFLLSCSEWKWGLCVLTLSQILALLPDNLSLWKHFLRRIKNGVYQLKSLNVVETFVIVQWENTASSAVVNGFLCLLPNYTNTLRKLVKIKSQHFYKYMHFSTYYQHLPVIRASTWHSTKQKSVLLVRKVKLKVSIAGYGLILFHVITLICYKEKMGVVQNIAAFHLCLWKIITGLRN